MVMLPGNWDDASIKSHAESQNDHSSDGVLWGSLTMANPQHPEKRDFALCHQIKPWRDILQLSQKLFQGASGVLACKRSNSKQGAGYAKRS
jgi:hypothetical protein